MEVKVFFSLGQRGDCFAARRALASRNDVPYFFKHPPFRHAQHVRKKAE
jgi:hypothetical protein